jgi:hypothetical protein
MLHVLDFVRLHRPAEPLYEGMAPMPELVGTGFGQPQPVIRRVPLFSTQ